MEDYRSKRTGDQIEALLDIVSQGGIGGGGEGEVQKTTEAEILAMGFTKNEGTITEVKMNGVSKGASGVVDLGTVITEHQSLDGKVDKVSGKGLSTEDFTTALKTKLEGLSNYDDTELSEALSTLRGDFDKLVSGDTTTAIKTFNEVIAFLDGIQDSQDLASIIASIEQQIAAKMDKVTLATVATSGSYNDLSNKPTIPAEQVNADWNATSGKAQILNKPTIPSAVTESTVSGWGFTKNTGTYSKPSGGIPKSDLASAVQTSLGKADTALQSHQDISGKQDKLVSGTNIKTINGQSILGSGNITIEGGGGSSSGGEGYAGNYPCTEPSDLDEFNYIEPNTYYVFDAMIGQFQVEFELAEGRDGIVNEYVFEVSNAFSSTGGYTVVFPSYVIWKGGLAPTFKGNTTTIVSIVNNLGIYVEFELN